MMCYDDDYFDFACAGILGSVEHLCDEHVFICWAMYSGHFMREIIQAYSKMAFLIQLVSLMWQLILNYIVSQ